MAQMKRIIFTGIGLLLAGQWGVQVWHDWRSAHYFSGYIETDVRYFAASQSSKLISLNVARGAAIAADQLLFTLDPIPTQKQLMEAQAQQEQALLDVERKKVLFKQKALSSSELDAAILNYKGLTAHVEGLEYTITQLSPKAPKEAIVEYTYFNEGEWVPANQAVVSLLFPSDIKVRFFVPERQLSHIHVGATVQLECDGCVDETATISYIDPTVQYTPPVIYSRDERHKLLFLCEATLDQKKKLPIGLPILVKAPK